ncbi:AlbA family DNA-binding domain-containing protein [Nostoc sp.]|uniref:AlbA family DNA-binding domain-containing protein n=1 Tax=Nostoc sp. TaxID=1180 RepID=UPI002FF77849
MKDAWDWEEEDIELLIQNGVQESLTLEYKRCESLDKRNPNRKKDLSKDVSAFANSAGGVIVYGVIETNHLPTGIDSGYDPKDITREWLEQIINSSIQRRIDDVRIKQIELKKSNSDHVIYVVSIPQSKRAPHMAEDHIFYKRFNYQSMPMEEYEVRDVANRTDGPDLSLQFFFESNTVNIEYEEDKELSKPITLYTVITNESLAPAMYYIVRFFFDKKLTVINSGDFIFQSEQTLQIGDIAFVVNLYSKNYSIPGAMPVWQGVRFNVCDPHFQIAVPRVNSDMSYALAWSVDSLGMQQKIKAAILTVSNNQAKILNV